ncbi:MAG TPA: hypothetical protein VLW54_10175 [Candidatus Acidoferrales bacterium]|nr:hypothetical protein [Candidatus Acidoferrales bacterium]
MLTLFTTPKPFRGHIGTIQRNALASWVRLGAGVEVILFGDDEGAAEAARELGIRHVPEAPRHPSGFKYLNAFFAEAQRIARNPLVCYANCDIILSPDLPDAVRRVAATQPRFLMLGRRVDLDVTESVAFENADWSGQLRERALREGRQRPGQWIDYFVFPRGFYDAIPPFVIGRVAWDNWLVWRALETHTPVVDATEAVFAIHQNHDYGYHPQGAIGVWQDELAMRNVELGGGYHWVGTIDDATHRLTSRGMERNWKRHFVFLRRTVARVAYGGVSASLRVSRPLRHALGIHKGSLDVVRGKLGASRGKP